MKILYGYLIVFFGAGVGGSVRHAVNRATLPLGTMLPWGTFAINVAGSFVMGLVAGWFAFQAGAGQESHALATSLRGQHFRLFLTTGFLGGFTTFSAFSLEAALLWERGRVGAAALYVGGSVLLSIGALFYGLTLMRP